MSKAKELAREVLMLIDEDEDNASYLEALANAVLSEPEHSTRIAELEAEVAKVKRYALELKRMVRFEPIPDPAKFQCVGWGWDKWNGVACYFVRYRPFDTDSSNEVEETK